MKRRNFIKISSAGLLAGMLTPGHILANMIPSNKIGLQLYSLRNEIKEDLEGSLKNISDIGYKNLEAAGYSDGKFYGMDPTDFKTLVEDLGMRLTASHVTFNKDDVAMVLQAHREAGVDYVIWPWLNNEQRASIQSYQEVADKFNAIGKMCEDNGLRFGYHNHDFEFYPIDGIIPYDLLLESTDPKLVCMEIDLYWINYAGKDPLQYFEKYPGRFELWHIKDMAAGEGKEMIEVGSGIIDYPSIFDHATTAGLKEFFVEQDVIKGDGFESVKSSFDFINSHF
jgi:sugar phosphate isomerase/epimerase